MGEKTPLKQQDTVKRAKKYRKVKFENLFIICFPIARKKLTDGNVRVFGKKKAFSDGLSREIHFCN